MSTTETQSLATDELYAQAMKLSPEDRLELVERVIASTPLFPDKHTEEELADVVERRWNEIVEGKVQTIPGDEVFRRIQLDLDENSRKLKAP